MLKKAGIVVATVAAGLLAVSPLAFAGDYNDNHHSSHHKSHKRHEGSCNPTNSTTAKGNDDDQGIGSGNSIGVNLQDVICNTNALNDLGIVSILNPHKNTYNQGG